MPRNSAGKKAETSFAKTCVEVAKLMAPGITKAPTQRAMAASLGVSQTTICRAVKHVLTELREDCRSAARRMATATLAHAAVVQESIMERMFPEEGEPPALEDFVRLAGELRKWDEITVKVTGAASPPAVLLAVENHCTALVTQMGSDEDLASIGRGESPIDVLLSISGQSGGSVN